MDTAPLQPLEARWPNDEALYIPPNNAEAIGDLVQATMAPKTGINIYTKDMHYDEADTQAIKAFAEANGWTYVQNEPNLTPNAGHPPAWYGTPTYLTLPIKSHIISGTLEGFEATMFLLYKPSLVMTSKSNWKPGEKVTTLARQTVIKIKLPKLFPQLVLDSNRNDEGPFGSITAEMDRKQLTSLEGDFNKIFDFYSPAAVPIDTRVVLAPNFMQDAINGSALFDVEFYGDELIFLTNKPLYTPDGMALALPLIHEQLAYITRLLPSWNYTPSTLPFDTLKMGNSGGWPTIKFGWIRIAPKFYGRLLLAFCVILLLLAIVHAIKQDVSINFTTNIHVE